MTKHNLTADQLTAADVAAAAAYLTALRTAPVNADALAAGDLLAVAMTGSGKVKVETANRWHVTGDTSDMWGIAYRVSANGNGKALTDYQRNGIVCGFARGADNAAADVADKRRTGLNGRDKLVKSSVTAVPAYLTTRADYDTTVAALTVAYVAWCHAVAGGTFTDAVA